MLLALRGGGDIKMLSYEIDIQNRLLNAVLFENIVDFSL